MALARAYHANIATFYNTRLERVPDRYVADLVKMQPEPLFQAEGFERQAQKLAF
ncbi:MAG: LemA family protein [Verrucomicrobiota bacterium]